MLTQTQMCSVLDPHADNRLVVKSTKFVPALRPPLPADPYSPSVEVLPRLREIARRVENEPGRFENRFQTLNEQLLFKKAQEKLQKPKAATRSEYFRPSVLVQKHATYASIPTQVR